MLKYALKNFPIRMQHIRKLLYEPVHVIIVLFITFFYIHKKKILDSRKFLTLDEISEPSSGENR